VYDEAGKRLPPPPAPRDVANAVRLLPAQGLVVDGVVILYPDGRPRTRASPGAGRAAPGARLAHLTDLLFLDGTTCRTPLDGAKALLAHCWPASARPACCLPSTSPATAPRSTRPLASWACPACSPLPRRPKLPAARHLLLVRCKNAMTLLISPA
jgi:hypothetical protein